MKFETTAKILTDALRAVGQVIEPRNTIPVLGTVLFDGRSIRGTDLDAELTLTVPASTASGTASITDAGAPAVFRGDGTAFAVLMPARIGNEQFAAETLSEWLAASAVGRAA